MFIPAPEEKPFDRLSDEELAGLFRQSGNQEIIGELFSRYSPLVLGVCYKYLNERETARDTAMGVFESLFSTLKKYEVSNFRSWLLTVTKSHCAQVLRKQKKESAGLLTSADFISEVMENRDFLHPSDENETTRHLEKLNELLVKLPPGQQQCLLMFYFENRSYQQISEATGHSLNEVKSHIQNGKRNLKINLERYFTDS